MINCWCALFTYQMLVVSLLKMVGVVCIDGKVSAGFMI